MAKDRKDIFVCECVCVCVCFACQQLFLDDAKGKQERVPLSPDPKALVSALC